MIENLRPFSTETTSEGQILGLANRGYDESQQYLEDGGDIHGDTFGVDGSQVGVFEEGDKISLGGLLQRHDGG